MQQSDNVQLGGTAATVAPQTTTFKAALHCAPAVTRAVLAPADETTVKLAAVPALFQRSLVWEPNFAYNAQAIATV